MIDLELHFAMVTANGKHVLRAVALLGVLWAAAHKGILAPATGVIWARVTRLRRKEISNNVAPFPLGLSY